MKKILSVFLSEIILLVTLVSVPFVSSAEYEEDPDYWNWYTFKSYYDENGDWLYDDTVDYVNKSDGTLKIVNFNPALDFYYDAVVEIPSHRKVEDNTPEGNYITAEAFTEIGAYAFSRYYVPRYVLPDTIKKIGASSFADNSHLTTIKLSKNLRTIGSYVFEDCVALKEVSIPDSVTQMGAGDFTNCSSLEKVKLSKNVKYIPANTFKNCVSLKSFTVPNQIKQIKANAFSGCSSLSKVTFSNNLTEIGTYAFENCKALKSISFPNGITKISEGAFAQCNGLKEVKLPNSLTSIGAYTFENCKNIKTIMIPKSVTKIGDKAFGFYYNNKTSEYKKYKGTVIKGYTNTAAEKYAKKNKIKFSAVLLKTPKAKITAGKKKITIKYTKVSGASGFQVQYTKGKKTVKKTYKTSKSATKAITKLKKGKYKVKVRAYYLNSKKQKAYSPWTKTKTVTVK